MLETLIPLLASLGGSAVSTLGQNWLNRSAQDDQNSYNSPKAQMERFAAAGLNPNLIYSQGSSGLQQSPVSLNAPNADFVDHLYKIASAKNLLSESRKKQQQIDSLAIRNGQLEDELRYKRENVLANTYATNLRGLQTGENAETIMRSRPDFLAGLKYQNSVRQAHEKSLLANVGLTGINTKLRQGDYDFYHPQIQAVSGGSGAVQKIVQTLLMLLKSSK
jgi:hypothetical protein